MNIVKIGKYEVGAGKPLLLIGGPCVAESEAICLEIAAFLKEACAKRGIQYVFKASFDKANRSSGRSFRGNGMAKGLEILRTVREKMSLPVLTDIHESEQVPEVAKAVDVLQIPAFLSRQTDLLVAAAYMKSELGAAPELVASGDAVVPAAHAFAADPSAFAGIAASNRPASWSEMVRGDSGSLRFFNCVNGALRHYDWPDLLP